MTLSLWPQPRPQLTRAMLFKDLATLRRSVPVSASAQRLRWSGPRQDFRTVAVSLGASALADQADAIAPRVR